MQGGDADLQQLHVLSSTCEELSTSTTRRDQELQSLAELLQSIKQLQNHSQAEVGVPLTAAIATQDAGSTTSATYLPTPFNQQLLIPAVFTKGWAKRIAPCHVMQQSVDCRPPQGLLSRTAWHAARNVMRALLQHSSICGRFSKASCCRDKHRPANMHSSTHLLLVLPAAVQGT